MLRMICICRISVNAKSDFKTLNSEPQKVSGVNVAIS